MNSDFKASSYFNELLISSDEGNIAATILAWTLPRLLDFAHHWGIGALLMIGFPDPNPLYWFGFSLFVDDLPDIPRRFRGYFTIPEELEEDA